MLEIERTNKAHLGVRHSDKEFQACPTEICHISRLLCGFPACQSGVFLLADRWIFIFQVLAKLYLGRERERKKQREMFRTVYLISCLLTILKVTT